MDRAWIYKSNGEWISWRPRYGFGVGRFQVRKHRSWNAAITSLDDSCGASALVTETAYQQHDEISCREESPQAR